MTPEAICTPDFAAALQAYDRALADSQALLTSTRFERGIELRHVKRIVQPLVEAALSQEPTTVGLTWACSKNEPWAHGVHVCIVSIGMGQRLGLDRGALVELGVAALLHDVGQSARTDASVAPSRCGEEWRAQVAAYPILGVEALANSTTLNRTSLRAMRVALEHHACGQSGYPKLSAGSRPAAASRLVAVADAFVSLLSLNGERGEGITPYEALGLVLGQAGEGFDGALKAALVRAVGVYPPGQVVELDDHALARVFAPSAADPERPIVERVTTPEGGILADHERVVMRLSRDSSVLRALPFDEWPDLSADAAAA
ncbi:MAG: HD domain-containing phosphohydrolase [Candidatus Eisenbacteria bacterium]